MDQERSKILDDTLVDMETIGFFAAIGMHFDETTPFLDEELGDYVKGTPWKRFSATDQCFRIIHQLAIKVWRNLERIVAWREPGREEKKELKPTIQMPYYTKTIVEGMILCETKGETVLSPVMADRQAALLETQKKIETIGFFADLGIHFAESTPSLREALGKLINGTPWEMFSSTDQCFKMIHQLAADIWHTLEGIGHFIEAKIGATIEPPEEKIEPQKPIDVKEIPSHLQTIAKEINGLKILGGSILSLARDEKQFSELEQERIKNLGELIINTVAAIHNSLMQQKWHIDKDVPKGEVTETQLEQSLELIGEEINRIKSCAADMVAMGTAFQDKLKFKPMEIETLGQMIVDLADKVAWILSSLAPLSASPPFG